jgi:8-oxo-dGTP diphosphatase
MQTLEPLATQVGRDVQADERLAENTGYDGALALLAELPDGSVLCSHGDVIPDTMGALQRRGCRFLTAADWRKASVWELTRGADGQILEASAWPPPDEA